MAISLGNSDRTKDYESLEDLTKSDYLTSELFILPQTQSWNQNHIMRRENIMTSGGYYVATHIQTVWKRLAGLEPDQPHGWSFPDVCLEPHP